jgi:hypothetical protein
VASENRLARLLTSRTYCFNAGFSGLPNGITPQPASAVSRCVHKPGVNSRDVPQRHELRILLGTKQIAWEHGTVEEKRELLNQVRGFAERFYEAATKGIQKQWAEARRSCKQEELIERWKRQILQPRIAYSGSGIGRTQSAVEEQQRSKASPERRPEPPPRTPTVEKTWIEFRLIDEYGKPVPNARYRINLTDGSIRNGSLDGQGRVLFDNIDPGQCEITFPEIDAREWLRFKKPSLQVKGLRDAIGVVRCGRWHMSIIHTVVRRRLHP